MVAVYDHLPDNLKTLADKLWAVHGNDFNYAASRVELLHDDTSRKYRRQYAAQVLAAVALSQSIGMLILAASAGRWVSTHGPRPVFILGSAWGVWSGFAADHQPHGVRAVG